MEKFNKMNWTAVTQPLKGSFKQAHSFYQGHVHTNADVMKRRILYTSRPFVHTKPVNQLTETVSFSNRSPEWCKAGRHTNQGKIICGFKNVQIRVDSGLNPSCVASHNVDSINQSESRKIYLFGPIEQD